MIDIVVDAAADAAAPENGARKPGREFMDGLGRAARDLRKNLQPVTVEWGVAREERVTCNR